MTEAEVTMTNKDMIRASYTEYTPGHLIHQMNTCKAQILYHVSRTDFGVEDYHIELLEIYEVLRELANETELGRRLLGVFKEL